MLRRWMLVPGFALICAGGCSGDADHHFDPSESPAPTDAPASPGPGTGTPDGNGTPDATGTPGTSLPSPDPGLTPTGSTTPPPDVTPGPSSPTLPPDVTPGPSSPTQPPDQTPAASTTPSSTATPVATPASTPPYGLESYVPNTTCALPADPGAPPAMLLEPAYPALRFTAPVLLTHAGDGSNLVFVVEQAGIIRVFDNDPLVSKVDSFLNIVDRVVYYGEMGLLGLAFDPDYRSNGYFYVNYTTGTTDEDRRTIVSRFQVDSANPRFASATTELKLIEIKQPFPNHNGGMIAFGPDGYLYIGMGDGGSGGDPYNNGQNRATLLGDLLRIDVRGATEAVRYTVPADNPFVGATDGSRPEIWAYGLRNPWRFSFDRLTGQLWAADVGQGLYEEIDIVRRGGNYGWSIMEGMHCYYPANCNMSGLVLPIHEYTHSDGLSITGGYVYRGSRLPELYGRYLYADYSNGRIWSLAWDGAQVTENVQIADSESSISSFGEDEVGEVYVIAYGAGQIMRFERNDALPPATPFPVVLSDTGCFTHVPSREPAAGVLPYDVNAPLWADGASKERWLALPEGGLIGFTETEAWELPEGTVTIKDFSIEEEVGNPLTKRLLETRLLVRRADGIKGYVYKWSEDQTEAYLLEGSLTETLPVILADGSAGEVTHYYPSRADCESCHTAAAGYALGLRTGQMNRDFDYGDAVDNQLRAFDHIGLFDRPVPGPYDTYEAWPDPADEAALTEVRARSYLAANCAHCHLPGGTAVSSMDLRYEVPLEATATCGVAPSQGDLGVEGALIVTPGDPLASVLSLRMHATDETRMPSVASAVVDPLGTAVIDAWIDELPGCP